MEDKKSSKKDPPVAGGDKAKFADEVIIPGLKKLITTQDGIGKK